MEESQKKNARWKKALNIALDVLFVFFLGFGVVSVVFRINTQINGALTLGDNEYRLVLTDSMSRNNHIDESTYKTYPIREIPVDSLVTISKRTLDRKSFYDGLSIGDVLTFKYFFDEGEFAGKQVVVTHRLIEKTADDSRGGEYVLTMMGDLESTRTKKNVQTILTYNDSTSRNFVIGKVTSSNPGLGSFLSFMTNGAGIIVLVVVPCSLLFLYEFTRVISILREDRKEKSLTHAKKQQDEIERLKQELEVLKKKQGGK